MTRKTKGSSVGLLGRIGVAAAAVSVLGACQSMEKADAWIEQKMAVPSIMASKEETAITVRRDTAVQTIGFAPRSAELRGAERDALARFVARSGATRGDSASISLSLAGGRALAERRVAAIARDLHRNGLRVVRSFGPGEPDVALVGITRLVAVGPDCPQWRDFVSSGHVEERNPKIGCMTAASLATSVHRPQDLVSGRPSGPSHGATLDHGYQSLREGKFDPPFNASGTGSPQSGTAGTSGAK